MHLFLSALINAVSTCWFVSVSRFYDSRVCRIALPLKEQHHTRVTNPHMTSWCKGRGQRHSEHANRKFFNLNSGIKVLNEVATQRPTDVDLYKGVPIRCWLGKSVFLTMDRISRMLQNPGAQGGNMSANSDAPQVDTSEQIYISSLALLKMLKHGASWGI